MGTWQIIYGGVTLDAAAWGVRGLSRERKSARTDTIRFSLEGAAIDSTAPFAIWQPLRVTRNGTGWFSGIVTKIPRKGTGRAEDVEYEISGPWYWLERTIFQQQWVTGDVGGGPDVTQTTTQSEVTLGQSLDLVKMTSGQVMLEVLLYAQYAYQGIAFPSTVTVAHLPPAPPANTPFQIGRLTPSITVPYSQVRDKSCADIVRLMMKYSPDAVAWMDYTTTPPTLHIDQRANLDGRTVSVLNGTVVSGFSPTPRYDLQVPAVIAKFQSHNTIDGTDYAVVTVDKYPANVPDNTPRAWVQTIDLVGGSISYEKQTVSVTSRPTAATSAPDCLAWVLRHNTTLSDLYDFKPSGLAASSGAAGLYILAVETVVDSADPSLKPPYDMPADGMGYTMELVAGAVTPWMWDQDQLLAADATVKVIFQYTGNDAATKLYFAAQPAYETNSAGSVLVVPVKCKITNAGGVSGFTSSTVTQEYSTIASSQGGEPMPTGFAQSLYTALAELHFAGDLTLIEPECSDMLPIGCIFNTTDGLAEWQGMNALVLSVTENVDLGTTRVEFGPPLMLGLGELEELFRANLGRLPSYKLEQRQTGKSQDGATTLQGHTQSAASSTHLPPGGGGGDTQPYAPTDASQGANPMVAISPGTTGGKQTTGSPISVASGTGTIYIQTDFTYRGNGEITIIDSLFQSTTGAVPASTVTSSQSAGGSGTLYQPCCSYNAVVANGKASTSPQRLIGGSQNFGVCSGAISGPWGV